MASPQELDGVSRLRGGIVFLFVAALFVFLGIVSIGLSPFIGVVFVVLAFIFAVIALIRMYGAFSALSPYVPNMNLGKIGIILSVIPFVSLVGTILVGIAIYFIGDRYQEGTVKVGGILAAIPVISFIGYIISYIGLGSVLTKIQSGQYVPPTTGLGQTTQSWGGSQPAQGQTGSPQVYQVGGGSLRGNVAQFQLYSNGQLTITRVSLEGVDVAPTSVQPSYLFPGNNMITVTFSSLPSTVVSGNQYRLRIELSDGSVVYATVTAS
jgi:hypothetical protein